MLSIIICSKKEDINTELKINIDSTVGVPCELIIIDNSLNKYSIFEAYNLGVELANFENLCFVHDDVLFHTENWGEIAKKHLIDENTGLIGMAGSQYLFDFPSSWFHAKPHFRNLIQSGYEDGSSKKIIFNENRIDAVAVDGFCFFIKKELFKSIKFDNVTFSGFHFYDLDICMQVLNKNLKIYLINDILIEHLSLGTLNNNWYENAKLFQEKWKNQLPIKSNDKIKINFFRKLKVKRKINKLFK